MALCCSLENALRVLRASELAVVPEVQECLKIFSSLPDVGPKMQSARHKHPLIVFEGLDATGKSSVSSLLSKHLNGVLMSTPGPRHLPLRPFFDKQVPELRRAYYCLSNYAAAFDIMRTLEENPVILDRFWHSTAAYALGEQAQDVKGLPSVGELVYKWPKDLTPRPDVVFFLEVQEEVRQQRHRARHSTNTKEEKLLASESNFRKVVCEAYKRFEDPCVTSIDANGPIETVLEAILEIMRGLDASK